MEDACFCSPLNGEFYHHQGGLEEMGYSFVEASLELEATIITAKEEITRECELIQLKDALRKVTKERDECQAKCQKLTEEKLDLQQQLNNIQQNLQVHHEDHELSQGAYVSNKKQHSSEPSLSCSSDSDEKNKVFVELLGQIENKKKKALPEKGKLLKAVMEAGPLLQNLLLCGGPLPQWQHPPPQLHSIDMPPFFRI